MANPFGIIDILVFLILTIAVLIETLTDQQLYKFIKMREYNKEIITKGYGYIQDIQIILKKYYSDGVCISLRWLRIYHFNVQ